MPVVRKSKEHHILRTMCESMGFLDISGQTANCLDPLKQYPVLSGQPLLGIQVSRYCYLWVLHCGFPGFATIVVTGSTGVVSPFPQKIIKGLEQLGGPIAPHARAPHSEATCRRLRPSKRASESSIPNSGVPQFPCTKSYPPPNTPSGTGPLWNTWFQL